MDSMDKTIARLNIERFRKKLVEESDETRRQTLLCLLAEEEAKLAQLTTSTTETTACGTGHCRSNRGWRAVS